MEKIVLSAQPRDSRGKGPARRLRASGRVPAVLYGAGIEGSIPLALDNKELEKVLSTGAGGNVLVSLQVEGDKDPRNVMFKEVDRDPVVSSINHVDLIEIVMGTKVTVEVPINLVGKSEGEAAGGTLHLDARSIEVECLPSRIPDSIDVDVTDLAIGDSIHVGSLQLEEGLKVLADPETTIVSVVAPKAEEEAVSAEEAEEAIAQSFEEKEEGAGESSEE